MAFGCIVLAIRGANKTSVDIDTRERVVGRFCGCIVRSLRAGTVVMHRKLPFAHPEDL